ncbi:hypothetical protein HK102_010369, partial [Quaeritorhiza haematococci]
DDGISYEWDPEKNAWFPMWDENLIASQQAAYSVEGVDETAPILKPGEKRKLEQKQVYTSDEPVNNKKKKTEPKKKPNRAIYVNGLPPDVTVDEVKEYFTKCGIIMEDVMTGEPKIKIYKDDKGMAKGDALIVYFKEESVELACKLLDDSQFRFGDSGRVRVQKAVFQEKEKPKEEGESSSSKSKSRVDKNLVKKKMSKLSKKLDWFEEEQGKKSERLSKIVILKYMFTLQEIEEDPTLLLDLKEDVRQECEKKVGPVTNVKLFD